MPYLLKLFKETFINTKNLIILGGKKSKMSKNVGYGVATIIGIIALLIGCYAGYLIHPDARTIEVEKIVTKDVPVQVEKIVEKEVLVEKIVNIPLDIKATYLDKAIKEFTSEIEDLELTTCDEIEYDEDQIAVKKVYDAWNVEIDEDEYSVTFSIKLKYLDSDVEEKCYNTFNVNVFYEPEENPEITILE